jgi:hypothetical protein
VTDLLLPPDCPTEPAEVVVWSVTRASRAMCKALGVDPDSADAATLAHDLIGLVVTGGAM